MKKGISVMLFALIVGSVSLFVPATVFATDGMNLEGYGPIATGMGGASMAYDNGTAAMMNNPATLGLMPEGNRLDVAFGYLGPNIKVSVPGQETTSQLNAFYMPAIGWVQKSGQSSYGVGVFAQGGMGAQYSADSFMAAGSGDKVRSELSVGRLIIPYAYQVDKNLILAASVDYVWAGLDLKMALPGAAFLDMAAFPGSTQTYGTVSGSMMDAFGSLVFGGGAFPAGTVNPANPVNYGRFDFSDNDPFTGKAMGSGFAGKLGGVYKINDAVSVGLTYHSKTWLGDLETNGAQVSFNANVDSGVAGGGAPNGVYVPATIPLTGKIQIKDFQWPQMIGAGVSYQASDNLMVVFDYKWINWADVMKNFKMVFTADSTQSNPMAQAAFGGTELDATLFQKWRDQHVFMIGAGYKVSPDWILRAGLNITNNPIPDTYLNALFPAIEKNHVTLGAGYMITKASSVDASFTYAPEVKATNGQGQTITHSQTNSQVMYSYRF